ncbi:hypothetical protein [Pseudaeromonas paramecii]|uniref:Outer membrane assembly lipoprotein YfiO n=1 Tax=Pseudaeromonas paramecii TaxID=2138166 RepID=A0ABP8QG76_9GAMM
MSLQLDEGQCGLTGLPFLSADNDTRVNLALLAEADGHFLLPSALPVPFSLDQLNPEVETVAPTERLTALAQSLGVTPAAVSEADTRSQGWLAGRCSLNRLTTTEPFLTALQQDGALSAADRLSLAQARLAMVGLCQADTLPGLQDLPSEGAAAPYADYLRGARAFYLADFDEADRRFATLAAQPAGWLAQTARYLLARVAINRAQVSAADEYGFYDLSRVDKAALQQAGERLDAYLAEYPQGLYADSARGLYRRVAWLMGDDGALTQQYLSRLQQSPVPFSLFDEIDNKLLAAPDKPMAAPPFILVQDLRLMRAISEWETRWQPLHSEQLATQQAEFAAAGWQAYWDYLQLAQRYYVQKDLAGVLSLTAQTPADLPAVLQFSRQVLRGMALMGLGRWPEAEQHWRQLRQGRVSEAQGKLLDLALAMTLERADQLDNLFAADSGLTDPRLREPLLRFSAAAPLLRQLAQNKQLPREQRNTALFTLLYKDLTRGHYADFLQDKLLMGPALGQEPFTFTAFGKLPRPDGYACPALDETVASLAKAANPRALNCLGDLVLQQGWDDSPLGDKPDQGELGGAPDRFAGQVQGRLSWYRQVIADTQAPAEDRSYALYRAINCFASSGYNHCGSEEIAKAERKAWFQTLKGTYGKTPWAAKQKYYW